MYTIYSINLNMKNYEIELLISASNISEVLKFDKEELVLHYEDEILKMCEINNLINCIKNFDISFILEQLENSNVIKTPFNADKSGIIFHKKNCKCMNVSENYKYKYLKD